MRCCTLRMQGMLTDFQLKWHVHVNAVCLGFVGFNFSFLDMAFYHDLDIRLISEALRWILCILGTISRTS